MLADFKPRPDLSELDEETLAAYCSLLAADLGDSHPTEPPASPIPAQGLRRPREPAAMPEWIAHSMGLNPVTGLPDRQAVLGALEVALADAQGHSVALAVVALDRFQRIDDSLGREIGDDVLRQVAERLQQTVGEDDLVGHLGADEFAVVFTRLASPRAAPSAADRLMHAVREPFHVRGYELSLTATVGLANHPSDASDAAMLLRFAAIAMHRAKDRGRGRLQAFTPEMREAVERRDETERGLRRALGAGELVLHYQPKLDLRTRRIVGVEALVRWRRSGGLISPGVFIPVAEESGLIVPIGTWCMLEACRQMRAWLSAGVNVESVAVNVSSLQFSRPDFVGSVERALRTASLPPHHLELEVTESLVMDDGDASAERLAALRRLGVKVAVDDFGTGYSSLAYLQRLPLDLLKIDRSFVSALDQAGPLGEGARAVASVITSLGHSLGLRVLAEGVETVAQLEHLVALECDEAQGFYFARPVPASEIPALAH